MLNRWIEPELLDTVGELDVGCIAFSPLAQGMLTDRYLGGIPEGSRAARPTSLSPDLITEQALVDISVSTRGGPPSYPHRKIALAGDRAEVAEELELEEARSVEYHGILESRLRAGHPDLAADTKWTAGWLAQNGDEAILWLQVSASGVSAEDAERARRALRGWCAAAGVRKLEVTDFSRRNRSAAKGDWSLA